ncbi:type II toxin-antitoxin system Y4mF family antitoxin [Sphingopyxis granuli]|uniref:type II toxin-antitoxin system Y4mF family antitoxin n=1 Tax=Sphingopyxis TaxID=165697 RepID=UPI000CDF4D5C|nr:MULTISPECIES: type II toxin-antitoxin system Y4mF family antitoxin [Sphingopyxis]AVA14718.1 transcriptional regulator [Sphingopyxis sp. MG]UNK79302.1 type II toxin-antitoxin system Y4mF family antitoxin [Sphingopyxis granuli]
MDITTLGQLVRRVRKQAGLRQDELAGAAGVGIRFIVDLESGKSTLQIGKVLHVLDTLGIAATFSAPGEDSVG